ncbi:MAG: tRNA lysidine(34) synthetase TilS [Bacteroidaceae bacterium]|nr:tRNA lysidine(34) synthetase TilS [Bacteroidaceae bacterium]
MRQTREKVANFIRENQLLQQGARVVVGLSGGPDSVCLAWMLHKLGYEVVAVHCNFHLRGDESMRDERFVETWCRKMGVTYRKVDFDTERVAKEQKMSIEMAARELRYDEFRKVMKETDAEAIAVGHHEDDNAETLLLNLTRGTGIRGLCGMQSKQGDVIRPLLCLSRKEILEELEKTGQSYVTDHTNLEDAYARNKVRLDIMPLLESINQGARGNITSTMENLNEAWKVYQQAIQTAAKECCCPKENGELHISIHPLLQQPSPISVLHAVLAPWGFNKQQLKSILSSLTESGRLFEANGRRLLIDRENIILESLNYPTVEIHKEVVPITQVHILKDPHFAYFDADKLHGELTLRTPQTGDTFAPFGMHGKRKLLSDFLTDQKLCLFEKERQPLLMNGNEIAWVVGRRSSELYRVDAHTQRVVVAKASVR